MFYTSMNGNSSSSSTCSSNADIAAAVQAVVAAAAAAAAAAVQLPLNHHQSLANTYPTYVDESIKRRLQQVRESVTAAAATANDARDTAAARLKAAQHALADAQPTDQNLYLVYTQLLGTKCVVACEC
jgi:hypothetical protein